MPINRIRSRALVGVLTAATAAVVGTSVAGAMTASQRDTASMAIESCRNAGGTPGGIDSLDGNIVISCSFPNGGGWVCDVRGDGDLANCHYWTTPGGPWHPEGTPGGRPVPPTTAPRAVVTNGGVVATSVSSTAGVAGKGTVGGSPASVR